MTFNPGLPIFYAVELDCYAPGSTGTVAGPGWGTTPQGVLADPTTPAASMTIRASDVGYRTLAADSGGLQVYPPLLASAFQISRAMNLDPTQSAVAAAWGSMSFSNASGAFNGIAGSWNSDGRGFRAFAGQKSYDPSRGIHLDPSYSALTPLCHGVATPWTLNAATLDVPLRDATYWLERPLQTTLYGGTGGLDGGADLAGKPKPKTRGGTAANPVCNVPAVLVDATNRIYQYSDGPGTVVAVYEGGDGSNILAQGDVADLYTGTTAAGYYRTCNAKGLFQLGSTPVRTITADVTGAFPVAGQKTTLMTVAQYLLSEDLALPSGNLYTANLASWDLFAGYTAGVYFGSDSVAQGVDAVSLLLGSAGWKLVCRRDGTLMFLALADVSSSAPVATFSTANAVSLTPRALPSNVAPPPYRLRVAYQRAWATQTTDLSPNITAARKTLVAAQDRYAVWSSNTVLAAYRRPNDPDPIGACLLKQSDAQTVANLLGALWGVRRRLYDVVVPVSVGLAREIGDVVRLTWPADDLAGGKVGQIVGEQFSSGAATVTLQVLV